MSVRTGEPVTGRPGIVLPRGVAPRRAHALWGWLGRRALGVYACLAFAYLFVPIAYLTVYSFNDGLKSNLTWRGFTLDNWAHPCAAPDVCSALGNSLRIGLVSTVVATVLGTLIAFALARHRFHGRSQTNLLIFLPMATPEVVLGSSLLTLFLNMRIPLGTWTIIISHVMFCISFVVVAVKARILSLDPALEQVAMDLYATEWQTFRRVVLPLVAPGILAGALLAFSLSFDDFIITYFTSGDVNTFPKFVYIAVRRGVPAQAYVIGVAMFYLALLGALLFEVWRHRRSRRLSER